MKELRLPIVLLFLLVAPRLAAAQTTDDIEFRSGTTAEFSYHLTRFEYRELNKELGVSIAQKWLYPAGTLGLYGFDVGVESTAAFIRGDRGYWTKATRDGTPPPLLFYPTIRIRKGLPFSFEAGTTVSYLPLTEQQIVTVNGRWALLEGFRYRPHVSIGAGYSAFYGNRQLAMGVRDTSLLIGYDWAIGASPYLKTARFALFAGYGKLAIESTVRDVTTQFKSDAALPSDGTLKLSVDKWAAGFQILRGRGAFTLSTEVVDGALPTVNTRLGLNF